MLGRCRLGVVRDGVPNPLLLGRLVDRISNTQRPKRCFLKDCQQIVSLLRSPWCHMHTQLVALTVWGLKMESRIQTPHGGQY